MNVATEATTASQQRSAPVKATWACLVIAWALFLIPVPGVGVFIGWPLNLVAFILAIVVMARGFTSKGLMPLLASLILSPIIYFVGLAVLGAAAVGGSAYDDYKTKAEAASGNSSPAELAPAADAIEISARDLYRAYDANEVAADSQYKGKALRVTGTVESVDSDMMDNAVVQLRAGDFQSVNVQGLQQEVAASLSKGQSITVSCTGAGEIIGSPVLDDCALQ